jgi:acyl carrier protein
VTKHDPARQLIAKALGRPVSEISDAAEMGTPESWDSLGHMRILMEIEAQLGHEIDPELAALIIDVKSVRHALSGSQSQ